MSVSQEQVAWAYVSNNPGLSGALGIGGGGSRFPNGNQYSPALIYLLSDPGQNEKVAITFRTGDVCTMLRAIDGRTPINIQLANGNYGIHLLSEYTRALETFGGVFLNQYNTSGAFIIYGPPTKPVNFLQPGDMLHHRCNWFWINNLGTPHNYILELGFGKNGVVQQIYHTIALTVPASTTYYLECETQLCVYSATYQAIWSKVTVYNANGVQVGTYLAASNGSFDTSVYDSHFLHVGHMDAASVSLLFQGYNASTELLRP